MFGVCICLWQICIIASISHPISVEPEFAEPVYDETVTLIAGETRELVCPIRGNPAPTIEWKRDNMPVSVGIKDNGQTLQIQHYEHGRHRYTCVATNKAGSVFRDFVIDTITPPKLAGGIADASTLPIEVLQGHSAQLECPIASSQSAIEIDWLRNGHPVPDGANKIKKMAEGTRLLMSNVQPEDEATFTCVARNAAGEATRNFKINVLSEFFANSQPNDGYFSVPPRVEGASMENVDVIEGSELDLQCMFVAEPTPEILWTKNTHGLPPDVTVS